MADPTDFLLPSSVVPAIQGNIVAPLIDGQAFLTALSQDLNDANLVSGSGAFLYVHSWQLGLLGGQYKPSSEAPPDSGVVITGAPVPVLPLTIGGSIVHVGDVLKQKAQAGVEVRVLGWVNPFGMANATAEGSWFSSLANVNAFTIQSIQDLRTEDAIGANAALDVLAHGGGATHVKLLVMGNSQRAVAYTGGLDLVANHIATPEHADKDSLWHDIMVRIEGPGVQAIYDYFRDMWNSNLQRPPYTVLYSGKQVPTVLPGATMVDARTLPSASVGSATTQSLRTIPIEQYGSFTCQRYPPATPLTTTGATQLQQAWQNAIGKAESYIYMEDQYFWSRDVMGWINQRLKVATDLKVILLAPARIDPDDDPTTPQNKYRTESINHTLLEDADATRVMFFRRWGPVTSQTVSLTPTGPTGATMTVQVGISPAFKGPKDYYGARNPSGLSQNGTFFKITGCDASDGTTPLTVTVSVPAGQALPVNGVATFLLRQGITVHSKTTIIDDKWAIIGSANCTRRSLYTDWEHAIGFIDAASTVQQYRMALWNEHFGHSNPDDFLNLNAALNSWNPAWGQADGIAPPLPTTPDGQPGVAFLESVKLPFSPESRIDTDNQQYYDVFEDIDSRTPWGSMCDIVRAKVGH